MASARILIAIVVVSGCGSSGPSEAQGGGGSWAGLYQVTRYTGNRESCEVEGPVIGGAPFFHLTFAGGAYRFATCAPDAGDCDFGTVWFEWAQGDTWLGQQGQSSESGTLCTLYFKTWSLSRAADGTVRVELRERAGLGMEGRPCSADEARQRGPTLKCDRFQVFEGRPPGASGPTDGAAAPVSPDAGASADADRGAPGSGVPCSMRPCGGNLVGRWQVRETCHSRGQPLANINCPKLSYDRSAVTTTGEMSFTSDGRFEIRLSHRGTTRVSYSLGCPNAITCADLERTLRPADPTASCTQSADTCQCTIEARDTPEVQSGPFRIDNLLLATTPQGALAENLYQFCVEGADMKIAGPITPGPAGEKIAAGVYTLFRQ
jgi:hypothetical protein